ncbi:MAG: ABC transporter ATP-binding protein [Candidatus Melainabacteria bacterium]|nr:ABC transporter ATP-binding protein [Candidatus Melainabacteria bacterium]
MTTELILLKKVEKSFLFGSFQDWSLTDLLKSTLGHEKHVVLKDIDLSVRKGECIGIVGEQDSGKTLLMKLISGSSLCTKGLREVNGKVFFLPNSGLQSLHPELTVKSANRKFKNLSRGEKLKLILSLAVFVSVDIILIDEALPLQDKDFLDKLKFKISEFKKAGKAFIITATSTNPIKRFCDRFLFMKNGRLVAD